MIGGKGSSANLVVDRVLYFANVRIPSEKAHGKQIFEMCNAFASRRKVLLAVPRRYQSNPDLLSSSMEDYFGPKQFDITVLSGPDELHKYIIDKAFVRKLTMAARTFINTFSILRISNKNDLVYTREWWPAVLLACAKKNVVYEAHQYGTKEMSIRSIKFGSNALRIFGSKLKLICISEQLSKSFHSMGFLDNFVSHDAVRLDQYIVDLDPNEQVGKQYDVLYTGQLFPEKGVSLLIESARQLPDINFGVVGGYESAVKEYQDIASAKEISNIEFLGQVSPAKTVLYQRSSKCLVLPQITDQAQSPMKLFEYMAAGAPIVASATGPIQEILQDGENALLFPPGDIAELVQRIKQVFESEQLCFKLVKQARADVENNFTWDSRAKNILEHLGCG